MATILKEPLVHFLVAGFFLFVFYRSCSANNAIENTIRVDRELMLNYMQFQSKAFNQEVFESKFDDFSEIEKAQLVDSYIKDEVLYREAIGLGLDQNDFVLKRRIIQKMEFILNDFDESDVTIPNDSLEVYYTNHPERYYSPAVFTFTHIYFKSDSPHDPLRRAQDFMKEKGHKNLTVSESLPYGDRFLYHRNYAEKTVSFLESQFGSSFVQTVNKMEADSDIWQGPVRSEHGQHWVKLLTKTTGSVPELQDIISVVRSDYIGYLKQRNKQTRLDKLLEKYEVSVDL